MVLYGLFMRRENNKWLSLECIRSTGVVNISGVGSVGSFRCCRRKCCIDSG